MIRDDFTRFKLLSNSPAAKTAFLYTSDRTSHSGIPCPIEDVRTYDDAEFKSGAIADLSRN